MGRGSRRLTTAWIPWHDIPLRTGGVAVVDRSHSLPGFSRVRQTYGEQEVHGMLSSDPLECIGFDPAARWLTADYRAGDVLAFPMDLLHGSCTNRNDATAPLRLSSDIRFQPRSEPVDDRNTAHGADEPDYTWDESNGYHLGESFSSKESQSAPIPALTSPSVVFFWCRDVTSALAVAGAQRSGRGSGRRSTEGGPCRRAWRTQSASGGSRKSRRCNLNKLQVA